MDPVTAGFQTATAICELLSTPAGQRLLDKMLAINDKIAQDVAGIVGQVNAHFQGLKGAPNA